MTYYLAIRRNWILMHTTIWMKLVYAEGKKPDTKDNILYYLYKILELQQVIFINRRSVVAQILEFGEIDCKGASFGVIEIFDILIRRV